MLSFDEKKPSHIIVVGNEKGGSGKSTLAMHVIVGLLKQGRAVVSIDLDSRQGTLSRYISNREKFASKSPRKIETPAHYRADIDLTNSDDQNELDKLTLLIEGAWVNYDVVVIDAPGSDSRFSRLAHSYADTLLTPINDSLLDFDVLAHVESEKMSILGPSHYSEMVWEQKKIKADRDEGSIDWIVIRNRIGSLDSYNARDVASLVNQLSKKVGFRCIPGLSERVIFRELFLIGLTILDLKDAVGPKALSQSHISARHEVQTIINAIGLPKPLIK